MPENRIRKLLPAECRDRILERANTRQDDLVGAVNLLRPRNNLRGGANLLECLLHRSQVRHAVIDDGNGHTADCSVTWLPGRVDPERTPYSRLSGLNSIAKI